MTAHEQLWLNKADLGAKPRLNLDCEGKPFRMELALRKNLELKPQFFLYLPQSADLPGCKHPTHSGSKAGRESC